MRCVEANSPVIVSGRVLILPGRVLILLVLALCANVTAQTAQQSGSERQSTASHDHSSSGNDHPHAPLAIMLNPIPDVAALDQDGRPLHFYSDLIKGKSVILNFIFTSCKGICPLQGANSAKIQTALGDRLGKEVSLVSVSIDPLTDTPQRLKSWGNRFGARAGWTLVTGKKADMDRLLLALTGDPSGVIEHGAIAFIGNYDRGVWIRADALDDPIRLIKAIDNALRPKQER